MPTFAPNIREKDSRMMLNSLSNYHPDKDFRAE